jgi:hypothetical protein
VGKSDAFGPGSHDWDWRGFQVDSPDGRVGIVDFVFMDAEGTRPEALAVLAGLFGRRTVIVSMDAVEGVNPRRRRVMLRKPLPRPETGASPG